MLRTVSAIVGLILGSSTIALAQNQSPSPSPREPEVTTNGRGEFRLAPDYAYVTVGVTTQSPTAVETASTNAAKVAAIVSALRALGLTEQQVTTSGYNLTQVYEYPKNRQPRLSGFTARNSIRAEVRHLDDLGKVIDAAINAGATDVSSIQFLASSTDQARRTALSDAVRQARTDADVIARAAGGTLGRLISVNTSGVSQPIAIRGLSMENAQLTSGMAVAASAMPTPIAPGELNVIAVVFTRWEFIPGPS
ncbi:MAG: SIMPL domain-containing protein, partial [Gemmatimonadaceae bacterium]